MSINLQYLSATPLLRLAAIPANPWPISHRSKEHSHSFFEIALLLEGTCTWHLRNRRILLRKGDILLLPPRCPHWEEVGKTQRAHSAWIGFDFSTAPPAELLAQCKKAYPTGTWQKNMVALFKDAYHESQNPQQIGSKLRIECTLRSMLTLLARLIGSNKKAPEESPHAQAMRATGHALANNLQNPLRIETLARYHGISAGYFIKLFQHEYGVTPYKFLAQARLAEAQRRLRESKESIKEIAAACGYTDAPHFCHHFKTLTGLSPAIWRKQW